MIFKRLALLSCVCISFVSVSCKPLAVSKEINITKNNIITRILKSNNDGNNEEDKGPEEVFSIAFDTYNSDFSNYLDITGLNVTDKENITLSYYDSEYVALSYEDVLFNSQNDLECSLSIEQAKKYDEFQQRNYDFDKYVCLIKSKYKNLNIKTKYEHTATYSGGDIISSLVTILTAAAISETAIAVFTSSTSALIAATSTSWIPFVGWVLAAAIAAVALIGLVAVIIQNWEKFQSVFDNIKNWFITAFTAFTNLITNFFSDISLKITESEIVEKEYIGGKLLSWKEAHMDESIVASIATELQKCNNKVLLMKNLSTNKVTHKMDLWIITDYVTPEYVIENKIYEVYFYSSYTWYNSLAKKMLAEGAPSYFNYGNYKYKNIVYHRFTDMSQAIYGWNHYHMGKYNPVEEKAFTIEHDNNNKSIGNVHAFFGLGYVRRPNNDGFDSYPKM